MTGPFPYLAVASTARHNLADIPSYIMYNKNMLRRKLLLTILITMLLSSALSAEVHPFKLAKKYYDQKDFPSARSYFQKCKLRDPLLADHANYYLGLMAFKDSSYVSGMNYFGSIVKYYPDSALKEKSLYYKLLCEYRSRGAAKMSTSDLLVLAEKSWQDREHDRAGLLWNWLLTNRPSLEQRAEVYSWLARYDHMQGRRAQSAQYLASLLRTHSDQAPAALYFIGKHDELIEQYPTSTYSDNILYSRGMNAYMQGNYISSETYFQRIVADFPDENYRAGALYWLAKIYKRQGRSEERAELLGNLYNQYPSQYWGIKAAQLLGLSVAPVEIADVPDKYNRLIQIGCYDDAGIEIWSRYLADQDNSLFILPFEKKIDKYAQIHDVPPALVAAVMREESRFNPAAISRSGAVGLMQLMPRTAKLVAKRLDLGYLPPSSLKTPDINIQLGTRYLRDIKRSVSEDNILILASYNAGPGAVSRLMKRYGPITDMDYFIESIPWKETRDYVKKVMRSYWLYEASRA
jgi:soluble lytic murein transglycosylase-like protein